MNKDITTWILISVLVLLILSLITMPSELYEYLPLLECLMFIIAFLCAVAIIVRLKCNNNLLIPRDNKKE